MQVERVVCILQFRSLPFFLPLLAEFPQALFLSPLTHISISFSPTCFLFLPPLWTFIVTISWAYIFTWTFPYPCLISINTFVLISFLFKTPSLSHTHTNLLDGSPPPPVPPFPPTYHRVYYVWSLRAQDNKTNATEPQILMQQSHKSQTCHHHTYSTMSLMSEYIIVSHQIQKFPFEPKHSN